MAEIQNWRGLKVENESERKLGGVIDPKGNWYNVPFAQHEEFARAAVMDMCPGARIEKNFGDFLIYKLKWIWIHHDPLCGTIIVGFKHMNINQFSVLLEFFGKTRLFRGWTVEDLWRESNNYEEEAT